VRLKRPEPRVRSAITSTETTPNSAAATPAQTLAAAAAAPPAAAPAQTLSSGALPFARAQQV
jgi:hypothetical protein